MIVRSNPQSATDLNQDVQAWFDSDAMANDQAIREIDDEAARYGLVRTREYWLQTFSMPDGRVVRRGFCYRPEPSYRVERVVSRRSRKMEGTPSVQIVREMRDGG